MVLALVLRRGGALGSLCHTAAAAIVVAALAFKDLRHEGVLCRAFILDPLYQPLPSCSLHVFVLLKTHSNKRFLG